MIKNPKVTVFIPVYNSIKVFSECLDSVVKFDYDNYNIVVADNKSTEDIKSIVDKHIDVFSGDITYARYEEHVSAEENFNRCIEHISGEFFTIYHADDIYYPQILSEEVQFLQKRNHCACVFSLSRHVDQNRKFSRNQFVPKEFSGMSSVVLDRDRVVEMMLKYGSIFHTPSAMFRVDIYQEKGYFFNYKKFNKAADMALWLEISKDFSVGVIQKYLTDYRLGYDSFSYHYARERLDISDGTRALEDLLLDKKISKNSVNVYYFNILKLKDLSDVLLNAKYHKHTYKFKNYKLFFNALKLLVYPKKMYDIYHLKIILWALIVSIFTNEFFSKNFISTLYKYRYKNQ